VHHREGIVTTGGAVLVPRARPRDRQRVREQGAADARCRDAPPHERRTGPRACARVGLDRRDDERRSRVCHGTVSVSRQVPAMTDPRFHATRTLFGLVLAFVLGATSYACSRDPAAEARKYVASGDAYVAKHQYREAEIQYKNAVTRQPQLAEAHYKLAKAYNASGEPVKAYGSFARAADLDPNNVDAQIEAGTILLAGGEFEMARTRAELALKTQPQNAAALILFGNSLAGLHDNAR